MTYPWGLTWGISKSEKGLALFVMRGWDLGLSGHPKQPKGEEEVELCPWVTDIISSRPFMS